MRRIAFDDSFHDVYEDVGNIWRAIWPMPVTAQAMFVEPETTSTFSHLSPVFREDSFDATTRIRRGRLYVPANGSGLLWTLPHPAYGALGSSTTHANGWVQRNLRTFDQYQGGANLPGKSLIIGAIESAWTILAAERISSGELLLTLKARRAFGILPEINPGSVPEGGRSGVLEAITKLIDSAFRESPESVVDRARDAAQICLATWAAEKWNEPKLFSDDLGRLIKKILDFTQDDVRPAFIDAANIVRLLHVRGKSNEKKRRGLRPIFEEDAELALRSIGFIICEFLWTNSTYLAAI